MGWRWLAIKTRRSRAGAQVVLWSAIGTAAATVVILVLLFVAGADSPTATATLAVLGVISAVTTVVANSVMVQADSKRAPRLGGPAANLIHGAHFVDRDRELALLIELLGVERCVSCHGPQGTGKSYLLQFFADVVNGYRPMRPPHRSPATVEAALYFDLADASGWEQLLDRLFPAGREDEGSWASFIRRVTHAFGVCGVLLILDNVNSASLWPPLGKAVYAYLAARPNDRVVLGSIDPVALDNLNVGHIEVTVFEVDAVEELARANGSNLNQDEVDDLHAKSLGLPLFLRLMLAEPEDVFTQRSAASHMLKRVLRSELSSQVRRVIAFIALLGLVERRIAQVELERLPIAALEEQLEHAVRRSLVSVASEQGRQLIQVHDIVRDNAIQLLDEEIADAALVLFNRAEGDGREVDAAIFAVHGDPAAIGVDRLARLLEKVIRAAIDRRDYALLESIHTRMTHSERMVTFLHEDTERRDLLALGKASQLAGSGRYREAEDELLASSVVQVRPGALDQMSEVQFDLYYLLADVVHLQNRYDEAAAMYRDLATLAVVAGDARQESFCLRGVAHVLRHQGRDLETALFTFDAAMQAALTSGDLRARMHATTGPIGIRVYLEIADETDAAQLRDLERAISRAAGLEGLVVNVRKYQAQVAWLLGRREEAMRTIRSAIDDALQLNDRILYNLYFEEAEFTRLAGQPLDATKIYALVLEFGERNGDRNLIANALLGLVACDQALGRWKHFDSQAGARHAALRAAEIASAADIQATVAAARRVLVSLDDKVAPPVPPRFIVF